MTLTLSQDIPTINLCSEDHISTDLQYSLVDLSILRIQMDLLETVL